MPSRSRSLVPLALAALTAAAAVLGGCQDYNFSPVKYGLIQPGTERVTLSEISTADILFVVDDSGSMELKQAKLAASFQAFIDNLRDSNVARATSRLEPIDFHIAVTTTSVFLNAPTQATCAAACAGATGQVCCNTSSNLPLKIARACAGDGDCTGGRTCRTDCLGRGGEQVCCAAAGAAPEEIAQACPTVGEPCGQLQTRYVVPRTAILCTGPTDTTSCATATGFTCKQTCVGLAGINACCNGEGVTQKRATCALGVGAEGGLYPRGDFVRAGSNPRVLRFTKDLFCTRTADGTACACLGAGAPTTCDPPVINTAALDALVEQFKANVGVGTCGSGQEQGLEAARRAIQKAQALNKLTARPATGLHPELQPDIQPGEWLHEKSKLVVVFVGDEDDCSGPEDPNKGVIYAVSGTDACVLDAAKPAAEQREVQLQVYADFLASLDRPVAAAFIVSAVGSPCTDAATCQALCGRDICPNNCVDDGCGIGLCTSESSYDFYCPAVLTAGLSCGGEAQGSRFLALSGMVKAKGSDTVGGSICQAGEVVTAAGPPPSFAKQGFSSILDRVAEVVKQPSGLHLPTQPASAGLTVLRIVGTSGKTRKTCYGPAGAGTTQAAAQAATPPYDWWFVDGSDTNRDAQGPTRFIYINRFNGACTANPGETYSADYLGLVPAGGCASSVDCQAALGGNLEDWSCDGYVAGVSRGTCLSVPH